MNSTRKALPAQPIPGSRTERLVLGFVLLALAVLVAVPTLVGRRVQELRETIEHSEPARTLVTSLEFTLVREMAALSEAMLTGDTTAVADYAEAFGRENAIYRDLERHLEALGPGVHAQVEDVKAQSARWHARAADAGDLLEDYGDPSQTRPRRERQIFEEVLSSTRQLDRSILDHTNALRAEIEAAERLGLNLTFALGLLAMIAGFAAALLAGRSRRFALESEQRRAEAEIALEKLAREADLRHQLLQGITHDVKNPIGAAKGFAELLAIGVKVPILPEQVPLVQGVQRSLDGALAIITELLDVARAESGALRISPVDTELGAVIEETIEDLRASAEAAGHALGCRSSEGPVVVYTDAARVRQILQNLLSNAVKYTPAPGTITVELATRAAADPAHPGRWAIIRVHDTGPGIRPEMRERVFDEFTRLEEEREIQGHGLGLAIARRIARLLGGDLRVEETGRPGATFVLLLPLHSGAAHGTT